MWKLLHRYPTPLRVCGQNVEVRMYGALRGYHGLGGPLCTHNKDFNKRERGTQPILPLKMTASPWLAGAFLKHKSTDALSQDLLKLPDLPMTPSTVEETVAQAVNAAGEPTLQSLGLGGWSPIGWVQHALDYGHATLDLPWWGCIAVGTLIVRLCVFPLVIMAQKNNALMNNNMPQIQQLQAKMTEARLSGNAFETARYSNELMLFMKEKGLNPIKNAVPTLMQAPFFISFFLGLRRMANCPIDSMKLGGIYWFTDLTIPDPYYILPLATSLTLWITIEMGVDQMKTSNQTGLFLKIFLRALPVVMLPFTINFPSAILCYWLSTNLISLVQVGSLRVPAVRDYFKIPKAIVHDPSTLPSKKKGMRTNIKESWSNMKISRELEDRQRTDEMIFNKAGKGPIVKTYKFDPTKHLATGVQAKDKGS